MRKHEIFGKILELSDNFSNLKYIFFQNTVYISYSGTVNFHCLCRLCRET